MVLAARIAGEEEPLLGRCAATTCRTAQLHASVSYPVPHLLDAEDDPLKSES